MNELPNWHTVASDMMFDPSVLTFKVVNISSSTLQTYIYMHIGTGYMARLHVRLHR